MAFDFKKEFKELYAPGSKPAIVDVPPMNFIAVRGQGDPNIPGGEYETAVGLLYAVAYTLKMSPKSGYRIEGFFDYVVPPLEGFWWMEGMKGVDYSRKDLFRWISALRLPDFVREEDVAWAVQEATRKKKKDFSRVEFMTYAEGLCVQCLHVGPYEDEPVTVELMHQYASSQGYMIDLSDARHHHEIYLSDPRKTAPARLKTIIRHPVKEKLTGIR
ncbi:MAG TPA: GyrI-like domain-containing protein [Bacillota bacterium]|nr:GyrI-like domain-containing protein [Bacillota bacterium]